VELNGGQKKKKPTLKLAVNWKKEDEETRSKIFSTGRGPFLSLTGGEDSESGTSFLLEGGKRNAGEICMSTLKIPGGLRPMWF